MYCNSSVKRDADPECVESACKKAKSSNKQSVPLDTTGMSLVQQVARTRKREKSEKACRKNLLRAANDHHREFFGVSQWNEALAGWTRKASTKVVRPKLLTIELDDFVRKELNMPDLKHIENELKNDEGYQQEPLHVDHCERIADAQTQAFCTKFPLPTLLPEIMDSATGANWEAKRKIAYRNGRHEELEMLRRHNDMLCLRGIIKSVIYSVHHAEWKTKAPKWQWDAQAFKEYLAARAEAKIVALRLKARQEQKAFAKRDALKKREAAREGRNLKKLVTVKAGKRSDEHHAAKLVAALKKGTLAQAKRSNLITPPPSWSPSPVSDEDSSKPDAAHSHFVAPNTPPSTPPPAFKGPTLSLAHRFAPPS